MKLGIYGHGTENNNVSEMVLVDNYSRKPEDKHFILLYFFLYFLTCSYFPLLPFSVFSLFFPITSYLINPTHFVFHLHSPSTGQRTSCYSCWDQAALPSETTVWCLASPTGPPMSLSCVHWTKNKICLKYCHIYNTYF